MKIEIYPLDKVMIDGVSIDLGMDKAAVEAEIGEGEHIGKRYYYYNSEMAIDYDNDQKVEFIEFLGGIDGVLRPVIYGVSAFEVPADDLIKLLKQKNAGAVDDHERGYSYGFLNISVGVYREMIPSDVEEMIEELKKEGISPVNDIEREKRNASHWATIGIGAADYYRR